MLKQLSNKYIITVIIAVVVFIIQANDLSAQKTIPETFCISMEEQLLFDKINILLDDYGNKQLDFSKSLSYVAELHINDLTANHPDTSICNLSSWSDKGEWTSCCHNSYVPKQKCMWDKPKELTPYPYYGYELVGYFEDGFTADSVIELWAESKEVLDMLLTNGNFKQKKWVCMGVGINEEYVSMWFGQRADKLGEPDLCSDVIVPIAATTDSISSTKPDGDVIYYIVCGSFSNPKDAKEVVKRSKKNGFDQAGTLKNGDLTRVYLGSYTTLKEAMFVKQNLAYTYRDAWIYKE